MLIKFYQNQEISVTYQNRQKQDLNIILIFRTLILNKLIYQKKNKKIKIILINKMKLKQPQ